MNPSTDKPTKPKGKKSKAEKLALFQQELAKAQANLDKYRKLFEADGIVDTEERKQLDKLEHRIAKAQVKLEKLSKSKKKTPTPEGVEKVKPEGIDNPVTPLTKEEKLANMETEQPTSEEESTPVENPEQQELAMFTPPEDNPSPIGGTGAGGSRVTGEDIDTTGMNVKSEEEEDSGRTKVGNASDFSRNPNEYQGAVEATSRRLQQSFAFSLNHDRRMPGRRDQVIAQVNVDVVFLKIRRKVTYRGTDYNKYMWVLESATVEPINVAPYCGCSTKIDVHYYITDSGNLFYSTEFQIGLIADPDSEQGYSSESTTSVDGNVSSSAGVAGKVPVNGIPVDAQLQAGVSARGSSVSKRYNSGTHSGGVTALFKYGFTVENTNDGSAKVSPQSFQQPDLENFSAQYSQAVPGWSVLDYRLLANDSELTTFSKIVGQLG